MLEVMELMNSALSLESIGAREQLASDSRSSVSQTSHEASALYYSFVRRSFYCLFHDARWYRRKTVLTKHRF
jgi:hypothetical protein